MSSNYYDAVVFKPKRNIIFHGFGINAHYNGTDVTYRFKWKIDDELSDEQTLECKDGEKEPVKKWHVVDIKELGFKPIKVMEGQKIDIMIKVANDNMRRCFYGTGGYRDRYSVIPE